MTLDFPAVLALAGAAVVVVGAYLLSPALAVVVGGGLLGLAWVVANGETE